MECLRKYQLYLAEQEEEDVIDVEWEPEEEVKPHYIVNIIIIIVLILWSLGEILAELLIATISQHVPLFDDFDQ